METNRGSFSRIGFILAAAGSAVGLGNLWKFPYTVGENGGGLFVVIYLLSVIAIAFPVLLAEVTLGRFTGKNPVGAFNAIKPGTPWKLVGYLGVASGFMILSFYSVVAGTTLGYFFKSVTGQFVNITPEIAEQTCDAFTSNPAFQLPLLALFIAITVFVVMRGVSGGIEKFSKILMPVLFGILILLLVRSLTLSGAAKGIEFYLKPDISALKPKLVLDAMGQAFFSLSLGMGTMITYGSYVSKRENLVTSAGWIASFDTGIALMAGFIIFPAIFSQGMNEAAGPDTMFNVLPVLFDKMPGGIFFGPLFFLLLSIAALTSTISILEVPVAYAVDERKWGRKKSAILIGSIACLIGVPAALSQGSVPFLADLPLLHISFMALWVQVWGVLSLSIGAFFIALFVGYAWKPGNALMEIRQGAGSLKAVSLWVFAVKYVSPLLILAILIGMFF
ncbi:sodium-dependent transporter [bacterium]|nr:sodium-dependent transporter [bacterium]